MNHTIWPPNGTLSQWILDQFPPGYVGFGVDVGASDGVSINTTFALEKSHRWTIISVEANPDFAPALKQHRTFVEMCACSDHGGEAQFWINETNPEAYSSLKPQHQRPDLTPLEEKPKWKQITVPVMTLEQVVSKWQLPQLDLLCIDTEGTELDVLKGCDLEKWKPFVIVTECWNKVGPIDPYLEDLGYVKSARNVHNDIFIRRNR